MQLREARMETDANEGKESPLTRVSENKGPEGKPATQSGGQSRAHTERKVRLQQKGGR